jgi:hypothetical protein
MLPQAGVIIGFKEPFMGAQQSAVPMFRTEIAPESGVMGWVIQQIAAPLPLVLWSVLVSPLEQAIAPRLTVSRNLFELFLILPIGWTLSFLLAILVQRIFPGTIVFGRRIWAVPVFLLALAFGWDLAHFSFGYAFAEFFYPSPEGENVWAFALMTCPTVSAIAYSLGMSSSTRRQTSKAQATRNSGPDDPSGVTLSSSL